MHHLILLLPIAAIPLFWVLPLPAAIVLYLFCLALTAFAWWFITRSLHRPVVTGAQGLVGEAGEVVSLKAGVRHECLIKAGGELWSARCDAGLQPGDSVVIRGVEGIRLEVVPAAPPDAAPR